MQDLTDDRQHEVNVETIGGITGDERFVCYRLFYAKIKGRAAVYGKTGTYGSGRIAEDG